MELIDSIRQIAKVYTERKDIIQTEEATNTALILPFISALGYSVFDPAEVVPKYTADVGIKKGEKVDYAIIRDGKPIMLIDGKWSGETLDVSKESQLMRYFKELKRFAKSAFKIEEIASTASELKYTGAMKLYLMEQISEPCEDFVRHMAKKVFTGKLTENALEKFRGITKKAFTQFISERVSDRLASALSEEKAASSTADSQQDSAAENPPETKSKIVTTQDEIDGYNAVKAILWRPLMIYIFTRINLTQLLMCIYLQRQEKFRSQSRNSIQ